MRKLLAAAMLTIVVLGITTPAAAGGWAVTTLDPLATTPVAGEPFDVGFTIRQHGTTPVTVSAAAIIVTDDAGAATRFGAVPQGPTGHHVATVEVPAAGTFQWAVDQGFGVQDLGPLHVGDTASPGPAGRGGDPSPWTVPLVVLAALLAVLGVVDLGRGLATRRRPPLPA